MSDKTVLEAEKEKLVAEMAEMRKQIMDSEFYAEKYYSSDEVKEFKVKYNEKAKRVSDIAHQLIRI